MVRMSAEERRESVVRAAIEEFSRCGYYGTSTEAIAKRVGVSQPYLFRLFPGKKAIFLAAAERCLRDMRRHFEQASEGLHGEEALHAMADAYTRLIAEQPQRLQMQLQIYVTVAAAEAAGDHRFGEMVRKGWMELWDTVHLPLGGDVGRTTSFMASGMLINTLAAMGFPPGHRVWEGLCPDEGADQGEGAQEAPEA
ncbi:TetR family transcriptional regulator [Streptomyces cyaneogriseus subsp. noncyanogenus]|uniref:TetR family transcriptional regulator n=1 Tax=Streptomyces cyaneogriseus subsp. noncyanogenus TaxID=477245 RepID=A0A0C5G515_9ACTN|nr:TetR/AcrR family transcriptional regulator [Streptomyces cyaneogriseus]AJP03309.1 TetR family transcriptional regulator [Streptomyces cyaneogriseus subsp. noncyanogenus]